jgi:hypothetical protein
MQSARPRAWLCIAALLFAVLSTSTVSAVEPQLNDVVPFGFQRGTEVDVQFTGGRLADAQEPLFYSPGITVKSWEVAGDNAVKAKLAIAPDCRLGIHAVRLRAATGISNLRLFSVGALPEVPEVEPNNLFTAPQPIALGATVTGVVQGEDVDYFVVDAKKGQKIVAEIEGLRLGYTAFDPYIAILNDKRFELARSDDASLVLQDCIASIVAPEDGKYIIQLRESSYGGDGNCKYRLHVGSFPRPAGVYPAGGRPGEALDVKCLGDVGGEFATKITLPADGASEFAYYAQDGQGIAPSANMLRVVDLPNVLEVEPNNAAAEATPAANAPTALNGIIQQDGDMDFFRFTAKKGEQYDVRVFARGTLRSPLDPVLTIHNAQGGQMAANDDTGGSPDSYLRFAVPDDGDFLVGVRDHLKSGGPTYVYRVEVARVAPTLAMNVPERQQYIATLLSVPRGNRMALMIAAQRQNFGSDLALELRRAPAGMSVEALPFTGGNNLVPVLFTAAPEAVPAGTLADLVGKSTDPALALEGHVQQRTMLIRGQNNKDVYGHDATRWPVAITQEVPFKIEIVPPMAPLVRDGQIDLKVVATRVGDFKAPISIAMLYNPPGVASSGSIAIPEGQNEAVIPLTANNGAAIGTHKIIVIARAAQGGGTVECASQFADLNIADSFFNIAFQKAAIELGQGTDVVIKLEKKAEFPGAAKVELVGLPAGTATQPIEATTANEELVFKVTSDAAQARAGKYTSLVCRTTFTINGMVVIQNQGTGELRIDAPLPPKVNQPAPMPMPMPAAVAAKPAEPKRLSRLEMLRQQQGK